MAAGHNTTSSRPLRMHHNAYVVRDQRATRHFYEDLLGLPLIATWTEVDELFGAERVFCHTFYGLADGSALAFFQFASLDDQALFEPQARPSPFIHVAIKVDDATQRAIAARLTEAQLESRVVDHGYCVSLYVTDPDGLRLELTRDHPDVERINAERLANAHADLERWMSGDHRSNNTFRGD
jgi:glyoxylase I family protein